jgi:stage III sporulation protein AA
MRESVDNLGKDNLQELRLRLNSPPLLKLRNSEFQIDREVTAEDLHFCVNTASQYSPWTAETASRGYITAPGGHRIGLCGNAAGSSGSITSIHGLTSLCLRVARDFPGIAAGVPNADNSVLIIGKPGSGKTTLLRDIIRRRSSKNCVAVVDEREEIFPRINGGFCFSIGKNTDVLSGSGKATGINNVLRTMGPHTIAIDEITAREDCQALLHAGWCGVNLLATAHAASREDLLSRPVYRPIVEKKLFDTLLVLNADKSWRTERMNI